MSLTKDKALEMMLPTVGHVAPKKSNVVDTYFKGALVAENANGYIVVAADTAGLRFAGIVKEQVVVGAGETKDIEVIRGTLVWLPHSGAAQTDVGKMFYSSADDTIIDFGTHIDPVGKCVGWRTGELLIDMAQDQPKIRSGSVTTTGHVADVDTGLREIKYAVATVNIAAQAAGDPGYVTVDHGADGLLDLYVWDDAGSEAANAGDIYWIAIGE